MLNRSVMIVRIKKPFLNWVRTLPNPAIEITLDEMNSDNTAYLLPEYELNGEREKILEDYFGIIFENQLAEWWTNPNHWPKRRDLGTFQKWFDIEIHSLILDYCNLLF